MMKRIRNRRRAHKLQRQFAAFVPTYTGGWHDGVAACDWATVAQMRMRPFNIEEQQPAHERLYRWEDSFVR